MNTEAPWVRELVDADDALATAYTLLENAGLNHQSAMKRKNAAERAAEEFQAKEVRDFRARRDNQKQAMEAAGEAPRFAREMGRS